MNLLKGLNKPLFILAPLDDVTDTVFRQIVADCAAPDLFFTEFTNVDGLQSPGRPKIIKKFQHTAKEQPLIAQLWGLKPENFYMTAQQIVNGEFGEFAGVDLNMGCPEKTVVKNGACSALIKRENWPHAKEIIKATKEGLGGKLPLSVKTRLGFSEIDMGWIEFLLGQNLDMLTIHGRTRKEMSKVPAHWEKIGEARRMRDKLAPKTLIVGNGDVISREHGLELADKYKLDGVMIGRGIFNDPFVFSKNSPWPTYTKEHKLDLYKRQVELFANTWVNGERAVHTLNKFCKVYISDFSGAKELREQLMAAQSADELLKIIDGQSSETNE